MNTNDRNDVSAPAESNGLMVSLSLLDLPLQTVLKLIPTLDEPTLLLLARKTAEKSVLSAIIRSEAATPRVLVFLTQVALDGFLDPSFLITIARNPKTDSYTLGLMLRANFSRLKNEQAALILEGIWKNPNFNEEQKVALLKVLHTYECYYFVKAFLRHDPDFMRISTQSSVERLRARESDSPQ